MLSCVVRPDKDLGDMGIAASVLGGGDELVFLDARDCRSLLSGDADANALLVQRPRIDEVLAVARWLRPNERNDMGLDNIDQGVAAARGVEVKNVDDFCIDEVAENAVAMVQAAHRRRTLSFRMDEAA